MGGLELIRNAITLLREHERLGHLGYSDAFEEHAEMFYKETGYMAPGKSQPAEMSCVVGREDAWETWRKARTEKFWTAYRLVLSVAESATTPARITP